MLPQMLDLKIKNIFPQESRVARNFSKGEYAVIVDKITENLSKLEFSEEYMQSVLHLLEATMSYIPSSTDSK